MNEQTPTTHNRRGFLRALGGAAAFAGFGQAFGQSASAGTQGVTNVPKSPSGLLNLATTAEALSVAFYHHALSGAQFRIDAATAAQLGRLLQAEQRHLELLTSLGGRPLTTTFRMPDALCADARCFAETGLQLEEVFTGAYIAAAYQFAQLGHPDLSATAAQLGASEAQHLSLLSQLAGFGPGELTLPAVPFRQLTDAPPMLAPYLSGGRGHSRVALPSAEQVWALVGAPPTATSSFVQAFGSGGKQTRG